MADESEQRVEELEEEVDELRETVQKMMPSRRDILKMGGAAAIGAAGMSGATGGASAGTDQVGTIGTASSPVDIEAEDINAESITATDSQYESVNIESIVDRPDWKEDSNSPFDLNSSPSVTATLADTGYEWYYILFTKNDADQLRTSGITASDAYDTLKNDDTRTSNAAQINLNIGEMSGEILVNTKFGRVDMVFNITRVFALGDVTVAGSNNVADELTQVTFENSIGNTVDLNMEVYHR